jgi:protein TonB
LWHVLWIGIDLTFKNNLIMKNLKKLPAKQLEKFSNIFRQLGLVLVLFVVYISLEHKTEEKTVEDRSFHSEVYQFTPDTEIIFRKELKKIIPKTVTAEIDVFIPDAPIEKGKNEEIETHIVTAKVPPVILNAGDIFVLHMPDEDPIIEDVPYTMIQNAPVFKGCEGLSKTENKVCFDKKMKLFVQRNFNAGLANELGLNTGKYKIQTQFLIDEKGNVIDIKIRAPHTRLEKETERLIKKLPKFTPGQQQNRFVRVRYVLPISFRVE